MRPWIERHEQAQRHVTVGRGIIDRQRAIIERLKVLRRDITLPEGLLAAFERSQAIFEIDLARIRQERIT